MNKKIVTKRLAVVKNIEYGHEFVAELTEKMSPGYVRQSKSVEVEFPMRPQAELIKEEVAELEAEIEQFKSESVETLQNMEARKAELLALVHGPENQDA